MYSVLGTKLPYSLLIRHSQRTNNLVYRVVATAPALLATRN